MNRMRAVLLALGWIILVVFVIANQIGDGESANVLLGFVATICLTLFLYDFVVWARRKGR